MHLARACLLATLMAFSSMPQADDTARNAMADAMARMMEAMGLLGGDKSGGMMPMGPDHLTMPGMMRDLGDLAMVARCERTAQAGSSPE